MLLHYGYRRAALEGLGYGIKETPLVSGLEFLIGGLRHSSFAVVIWWGEMMF